MNTRRLTLALSALALASASFVANAADQVFSNASYITINDSTAASPYPSQVTASGLSGNITKVTVTLNGLRHTWPGDLHVLLVSPGGQKIALMQRIGRTGSGAGCSQDFSDATLLFDASAASNLMGCTYGPAGGTFLPTAGTGVTDSPAPAPAGPYSTDLTTLNGSAAAQNGAWSLYVSDHAAADTGWISGGWSMTITTENPTTCASEGYTGTKLTWCQNVCEKGYTGATLDMWIHRWIGKYRDLPYCMQEETPPPPPPAE